MTPHPRLKTPERAGGVTIRLFGHRGNYPAGGPPQGKGYFFGPALSTRRGKRLNAAGGTTPRVTNPLPEEFLVSLRNFGPRRI